MEPTIRDIVNPLYREQRKQLADKAKENETKNIIFLWQAAGVLHLLLGHFHAQNLLMGGVWLFAYFLFPGLIIPTVLAMLSYLVDTSYGAFTAFCMTALQNKENKLSTMGNIVAIVLTLVIPWFVALPLTAFLVYKVGSIYLNFLSGII